MFAANQAVIKFSKRKVGFRKQLSKIVGLLQTEL